MTCEVRYLLCDLAGSVRSCVHPSSENTFPTEKQFRNNSIVLVETDAMPVAALICSVPLPLRQFTPCLAFGRFSYGFELASPNKEASTPYLRLSTASLATTLPAGPRPRGEVGSARSCALRKIRVWCLLTSPLLIQSPLGYQWGDAGGRFGLLVASSILTHPSTGISTARSWRPSRRLFVRLDEVTSLVSNYWVTL